ADGGKGGEGVRWRKTATLVKGRFGILKSLIEVVAPAALVSEDATRNLFSIVSRLQCLAAKQAAVQVLNMKHALSDHKPTFRDFTLGSRSVRQLNRRPKVTSLRCRYV